MNTHDKEFAVYYKSPNGKPKKEFTVVKKKLKDAEIQALRFGILFDKEFSHIEKIKKK